MKASTHLPRTRRRPKPAWNGNRRVASSASDGGLLRSVIFDAASDGADFSRLSIRSVSSRTTVTARYSHSLVYEDSLSFNWKRSPAQRRRPP